MTADLEEFSKKEIEESKQTDPGLLLDHFSKIIKQCNYENTYKMALAKAFVELCHFDEIDYRTCSITIKQVAEKFLKYYWNQTMFHDFIQNSNPEKPPVVIQTVKALIAIYRSKVKHERKTKYSEVQYQLKASLRNSYDQAIRKIESTIVQDVAWRFSKLDDKIYDDVVVFDKENGRFLFRHAMVLVLSSNAKELNDLINYRWGLILDSFNSSASEKKKIYISEDDIIDKEALLFYKSIIDIDEIKFKGYGLGSHSNKVSEKTNTLDLKERIKRVYKDNHFDQMGFHLYEDRNEFETKGIQLFATRDGLYKVCFKNSNIKTQEQLNNLNKYKVEVHYGSSKGYEEITWDVNECKKINNTELYNPKNGYFACGSLYEKDAVDLAKYLIRIKNDEEKVEPVAKKAELVETEKVEQNIETEISEIIKYNPLKTAKKGKRYIPVFVVIKKKVYQIGSWKEAFKIIMFFNCYKEGRIDLLKDAIDNTNNRDRASFICSSNKTEENNRYAKFAPELYIRIFQTETRNYDSLNKIWKWTGGFELYILKADENDRNTDYEQLLKDKLNSLIETKKYKKGSTKHLLASINARILSPKEKFYIRICRDFDKTVLIGDIPISQQEEIYLKSYMKNALEFMMEYERMYYHDKVFAFGMVRVALKHYASKTFWPFVKEEYGISIPGNYQFLINKAFRKTLKRYEKLYDDENESNYVQNMCMHAFVCDKCADQLFNYIFEFWRIDLERSIDNSKDEDGNDLFDILIEEIKENEEIGVQDIMIHTTMALKMNPIGCKNRFRRILKMIDECYWNNTDYSGSSNRLSILFDRWSKNKNSLFYKDIKSSFERRRHGRGEKLLSRPNILYNHERRSFNIFMPKQVLRNCLTEEHPVWRILIDGEEFTSIEPELIQGKASLYTNECSINIYRSDIYKRFEILLQSERANYYRRTIAESDCRFFNAKGRNIDLGYDYISKDANSVFVKKDKELIYLNGRFNEEYSFDSLSDVYLFDAEDGDVFILPNKHAMPVGRVLQEGMVGNSRVEGAKAWFADEEYVITSDRERLFFKASKSQFNGTSIKIYSKNNNVYFGKVSAKDYIEFKWDDSLNDIYGYFIDLHDYISKDGVYKVDLSIPGNMIRRYMICYIRGFEYRFDDAPYIFEETGTISFPNRLKICTDTEWEEKGNRKTLVFNIDENNKDGNEYVSDQKLHINYEFDDEIVRLEFELPALYWKFNKTDSWMTGKPGDIFFKDVPERIYIDGNIGLSNAKLYIENGSDLEESETSCTYDKKDDLYYFRTIDIMSTINRERVHRQFNLLIDHKEVHFLRVICRSVIFSKNITGDFVNNIIYGNFEIAGSSDFLVSIYYEDKKIEDNIPVVNGRFKVECDVKGGTYKIVLYELEEDDSGFDPVSFKIDEFHLEIMDASNLEGKSVFIEAIRDRELKYEPLQFINGYCINNLKKFDYSVYLEENDGFYSYLYDSSDKNVTDDFYYYSGTFGYYDHLNKFRFIKEALVIFDNRKNLGEALINIIGYDELLPLIFSPNRQRLFANDKGFSKLERMKAKTIDDDIYKIEIRIR